MLIAFGHDCAVTMSRAFPDKASKPTVGLRDSLIDSHSIVASQGRLRSKVHCSLRLAETVSAPRTGRASVQATTPFPERSILLRRCSRDWRLLYLPTGTACQSGMLPAENSTSH